MTTTTTDETVHTMHIKREVMIDAPVEIAWEAALEELGPGSVMPDGTPFPMRLEPWPGGRWFRDKGNNTGHLWGQVQVILPPPHPKPLLELVGPMPMSYPAINHVQYRLAPEGSGTRLTLVHRAMGLIPAEHRDGMPEGWEHGLKRIKQIAEAKAAAPRANGKGGRR